MKSSNQYKLLTLPFFRRSRKKLPPYIRAHLTKEIKQLETDPQRGKPLQGNFRLVRSLRNSFKGTEYRTAYKVIENEKTIILYFISTRENFYKEFSRYMKRRTLER